MLSAVWTKLMGTLAAVGAVLGIVVAAFLKGRSQGSQAERGKQSEKVIENVKKATAARRNPDRERVRKFDRPSK